jgi:hypothetical protein
VPEPTTLPLAPLKWLVNNNLEKWWKEAVVAQFEIQHLCGGIGEHEI